MQTALDTINAYAQNTTVIISIDQSVQYYTTEGAAIALPFTDEAIVYLSDRSYMQNTIQQNLTTGSIYYDIGEAATLQNDMVLDTADGLSIYMQVVPD